MWFTELAWPPMVILSMLMVVCGWMWSQRRRTSLLIATIISGAGIAGTWLIDELVVTDREQVTASVLTLADDVRRLDLNSTLRFISPREDDLKHQVELGFNLISEIEYLTITDVSVDVFGEGGRARSHFRANGRIHVKGHGDIGHQPTRWELTWQKEGSDWKVVDIERLNPITGETIATLSRGP